jgi:hypothetical protein
MSTFFASCGLIGTAAWFRGFIMRVPV